MEIRQLRADEYHRLLNHPWLKDDRIPTPENSLIVIAEEKGAIEGVFVAQVLLVAGPVWVSPSKRGTTLLGRMVKKIKQLCGEKGVSGGFQVHTTQEKVGEYAKRLGMVPTGEFVLEGKL